MMMTMMMMMMMTLMVCGFVAVYCTDITTRHRQYGQPLVRSLAVHVLAGAAADL